MRNKEDEQKILATSAILLIDAMVFQEVLARKDSTIETLSSIKYKSNIKKSFEDAWTEILKKSINQYSK
jgi:hypothetical protein